MLTYKPMNLNYIAFYTAESTDDYNEIFSRWYENNVEVHFTIDKNTKLFHLLYIESHDKGCGNATNVLNEIITEFSQYNIVIEALFYLYDWYKSLGFQYEHNVDEMFSYRMILRRSGNDI